MKSLPTFGRFNLYWRDWGRRASLDIIFGVESGEILGLLGPNGAGKTILVRQFPTELLPTSGEVQVMGNSVLMPTRSLTRPPKPEVIRELLTSQER